VRTARTPLPRTGFLHPVNGCAASVCGRSHKSQKRPCGHAVDMPRTIRVRTQVRAYFNELLIDVNLELSFVPSPFTAAMMASEMPAAINPYSIAVAPDSSAMNFRMIVFMRAPYFYGL
jgi:hypothetical protein